MVHTRGMSQKDREEGIDRVSDSVLIDRSYLSGDKSIKMATPRPITKKGMEKSMSMKDLSKQLDDIDSEGAVGGQVEDRDRRRSPSAPADLDLDRDGLGMGLFGPPPSYTSEASAERRLLLKADRVIQGFERKLEEDRDMRASELAHIKHAYQTACEDRDMLRSMYLKVNAEMDRRTEEMNNNQSELVRKLDQHENRMQRMNDQFDFMNKRQDYLDKKPELLTPQVFKPIIHPQPMHNPIIVTPSAPREDIILMSPDLDLAGVSYIPKSRSTPMEQVTSDKVSNGSGNKVNFALPSRDWSGSMAERSPISRRPAPENKNKKSVLKDMLESMISLIVDDSGK